MQTYKTLTESYMEVANTIRDQIKTLDRWALGAYAAKNFMGSNGFTNQGITVGPGLQFDVSGHKFKGRVLIGLNGSDLYDIYFVTIGKSGKNLGKITVKAETHDIYAEDLVTVLDRYIEGKE